MRERTDTVIRGFAKGYVISRIISSILHRAWQYWPLTTVCLFAAEMLLVTLFTYFLILKLREGRYTRHIIWALALFLIAAIVDLIGGFNVIAPNVITELAVIGYLIGWTWFILDLASEIIDRGFERGERLRTQQQPESDAEGFFVIIEVPVTTISSPQPATTPTMAIPQRKRHRSRTARKTKQWHERRAHLRALRRARRR